MLVELVRRLEYDGAREVLVDDLTVAGLTPAQVGAAARRLAAGDLILTENVAETTVPAYVFGITPRALQAVGTWPSPEQLVDRLLEALADAAEHAGTDEERSRARRALDALRSAGRDVLVNAAGGALGGAVA